MRIIKNLKKAVVLALTAILFTTSFTVTGAQIEAKAATNEVSLYYADNVYSYRGYEESTIYIKVKNLGYNKDVAVHHYNSNSSTWTDEQATYVTTLSDGSEVWKANIADWGLEYAIKYTVNGTTYWDNNNGSNYTGNDILGVNPVKTLRPDYNYTPDYTAFSVSAIVKNLAYTKVVNVKYTQDNWATSSTKALVYGWSLSSNEELWDTTLSLDANKINGFQYYVYYQVNGQTYYDNNFGVNYNKDYYRSY